MPDISRAGVYMLAQLCRTSFKSRIYKNQTQRKVAVPGRKCCLVRSLIARVPSRCLSKPHYTLGCCNNIYENFSGIYTGFNQKPACEHSNGMLNLSYTVSVALLLLWMLYNNSASATIHFLPSSIKHSIWLVNTKLPMNKLYIPALASLAHCSGLYAMQKFLAGCFYRQLQLQRAVEVSWKM